MGSVVVWWYLLIHDRADQLSDSWQWLVTGVKGHRLPGESNLEQKGDSMNGAPWACAAGGRLAAIRKPAAKSGRRAGGWWRRGRGHVMSGGKERAWGCRWRAAVSRHWLLSMTLSGQQRAFKWKRHKKKLPSGSVSQTWCVPPSHCGQRCPLTEAWPRQEQTKIAYFWNKNLTSGLDFPKETLWDALRLCGWTVFTSCTCWQWKKSILNNHWQYFFIRNILKGLLFPATQQYEP